jgi:hypothetical protein
MPRIVVTTASPGAARDAPVLLDEQVHSVHLSTGHAAAQLVERLAWAISDAEDAERRPGGALESAERRGRARGATRRRTVAESRVGAR